MKTQTSSRFCSLLVFWQSAWLTRTRLCPCQVFLGLHDTRDKRLATRRSVDKVFLHPDFQPNNYNNDIALLKLGDPVGFNQVIRPICLPPPSNQVGSAPHRPEVSGPAGPL